MVQFRVILLFVFASVAVTSSATKYFLHFPTPPLELVYNYQIEVIAGVLRPDVASKFIVEADLHLIPDMATKKMFTYFKNPQIQHTDDDYNKKFIPMLEEGEKLFTPFEIEYFGIWEGVKNIYTQKNEPLWVLNIKKSIASIFQVDLRTNEQMQPFSYSGTEKNIYGMCNVTYVGKPITDGLVMKKIFSPFTCSQFSADLFSSIEFSEPQNDSEAYAELNNERLYTLMKDKDSHYYFDKVVALQHFLMSPMKNEEQSFYISTNQTFIYKTSLPASKLDHSNIDYKMPHSLTFMKPAYDVKGKYPDLSLGRSVLDMKKEMDKLEKLLYSIINYLDGELEKEEPNRSLINEIMEILIHYEVADFDHCLEHFMAKKEPVDQHVLDLFYDVVPHVGTGASAIFIKNLIKTHKIDDLMAIDMLTALASSLRVTSPELLATLDELIHLDMPPYVKRAAMLAFSTFIYKTFKSNPTADELGKYVTQFYGMLQSSENYEDQLLYVQVLGNIKLGKAYKYLIPIVKGEKILSVSFDENLQMHALWALDKAIGEVNPDLLYETVYPVFINNKLGSELRIVALQTLLKNTNSSQLHDLFHFMQLEDDPSIYNYYYTYVQSYDNIEKHGRKILFKNMAPTLMKFRKNRETVTGTNAFAYESINVDVGTGYFLKGHIVVDKEFGYFSHLLVDLYAYHMNKPVKLYSVYYKVYELEKFVDMQNFVETLFSMETAKKNIKSEISFSLGDKVVYSKLFDTNVWDSIFLTGFMEPRKNYIKSVMFEMQSDYNFPSDLGTMVQAFVKSPVVSLSKLEMTSLAEEMEADIFSDYKLLKQDSYGLKTFNPFISAWHGASRDPTFELDLPLNFGFQLSMDSYNLDDSAPFIVFKSLSGTNTSVSFRTHVDTIVFEPTDYRYATKGKKYRDSDVLMKGVMEEFGLKYKMSVFDCEEHPGGEHFRTLSDWLIKKPFTDITKSSLFEFLFKMSTFLDDNIMFPHLVSCGVEGSLTRSSEYMNKLEMGIDQPSRVLYMKLKHDDTVISEYNIKHEEKPDISTIGFYRFAPHESSTSLCLEYITDQIFSTYSGNKNEVFFYYGKYYGHKHQCVRDGFQFSIDSTSDYSDAQKSNADDKHLSYAECQTSTPLDRSPATLNSRCAFAARSFRKSHTIINYEHVPLEFENTMKEIWNFMHVSYPAKYETSFTPLAKKNQIIIDVEYSMTNEGLYDTTFTFPHETYSFEEIDSKNWFWLPITMLNIDEDVFFNSLKEMGFISTCTVAADSSTNMAYLQHPINDEWTTFAEYFENENDDCKLTVYLKRFSPDKIAMKVSYGNETIFAEPYHVTDCLGKSNFKITMTDKMMKTMMMEPEKNYMFTIKDHLFIIPPKGTFVITYDGYKATFEGNRMDNLGGLCYV